MGGRFADEPFLLDGESFRATFSATRNQARLALPAGGRHSLVIPVEPVKTRRGGIEICEICIPTSPQTMVTMMPPNGLGSPQNGRRGIQCEWSTVEGVYHPAQEVTSPDSRQKMFRVPPAERLRVIHSWGSNQALTTTIRESESRNQISWTPNDIVLSAEFIIDAGGAILPSFWIQADPRLVLDQGQTMKMHLI